MTMRTKKGDSLAKMRVDAENHARFVAKVARNAAPVLNRLGNLFELQPLKDNSDNEIQLKYIGNTDAASVVAARARLETVFGEAPGTHDTYASHKMGRTNFKVVLVAMPTVTVRKKAA